MYVRNMDCERYQDLSELSWFSSPAQPWAAAEQAANMTNTIADGQPAYAIPYIDDFTSHLYTLPRSDSMEEVKNATALGDILPMRRHETLQVNNYVKIEAQDSEQDKSSDDLLKLDSDLMLFDTPDLLNELGDGDLIDYITSDALPRVEPSPPHQLARVTSPSPSPASSTSSPPPPPPKPKQPMKETYLAIPRELTAGSSDDKKIPKMLILKTSQTSTINLADMGMSIADRIKTAGKRQRTKRYSEVFEEKEEESSVEEEEEDDVEPSKRARRLSTTSSASGPDKYRELRDRNNEASRKSRMNRKEKEKDLAQTLRETERENTRLRARAEELEKLVNSLRKLLLQIVVNKGTR